jgi:hypothetical protein
MIVPPPDYTQHASSTRAEGKLSRLSLAEGSFPAVPPGADSGDAASVAQERAKLALPRQEAASMLRLYNSPGNMHEGKSGRGQADHSASAEEGLLVEEDTTAAKVPEGQAQTASTNISSSDATGSSSSSGRRPASMDAGLQPGLVFVPIVLTMDDTDHELLVEEWLQRQAVNALTCFLIRLHSHSESMMYL